MLSYQYPDIYESNTIRKRRKESEILKKIVYIYEKPIIPNG